MQTEQRSEIFTYTTDVDVAQERGLSFHVFGQLIQERANVPKIIGKWHNGTGWSKDSSPADLLGMNLLIPFLQRRLNASLTRDVLLFYSK